MSNQEEVVKDVLALLRGVAHGDSVTIPDGVKEDFGRIMGDKLEKALTARVLKNNRADTKTLHFSEIGHPCRRKVWYNVHTPDVGEKISGDTLLKFLYGDLIEELYLALVRLSGHEVTDEQKRCVVELVDGWKVTGYLDAKIDGETVDVKSASTPSFKKFEEGLLQDPFGYHQQLRGYCEAEGESFGSWHVVDKTLGHVTSLSQKFDPMSEHEKRDLVEAVDRPDPPPRGFEAVPEGKSGNMKLPVTCSYCPFKHECWKDANGGKGLRTFLYSKGPVFLTEVGKEPNVPEYTGKS